MFLQICRVSKNGLRVSILENMPYGDISVSKYLSNDYTNTYLKNRDPKFITFFSLWYFFSGYFLISYVWSMWRPLLSAHPGHGCMDNSWPVTVTRLISMCYHDLSFECSSEFPYFCGAHSLNARESPLWCGHTSFLSAALSCFVSLSQVILYDFTIGNNKKMTGIQKNDDSNGL